jgi:NTP pyrophosphatase (non-canonical NTP hydrolase)
MFSKIFKLSRSKLNTFPLFVRNSKITEELGEFSEALLHKMGYLGHKVMKEPLEGEAADVILCVLDTLACAYPELSEDQLVVMVNAQLALKCAKWERVMTQRTAEIAAARND